MYWKLSSVPKVAAADVGGDAFQVDLVYLNLMAKQFEQADVYFKFVAGNKGIFFLVLKINTFQNDQFWQTEADVGDLYFGMYLIFEKSYRFVFNKILHGGHLYQDNDEQHEENNAGYYPKDGLESYAAESCQGYKFFKQIFFTSIMKKTG